MRLALAAHIYSCSDELFSCLELVSCGLYPPVDKFNSFKCDFLRISHSFTELIDAESVCARKGMQTMYAREMLTRKAVLALLVNGIFATASICATGFGTDVMA